MKKNSNEVVAVEPKFPPPPRGPVGPTRPLEPVGPTAIGYSWWGKIKSAGRQRDIADSMLK